MFGYALRRRAVAPELCHLEPAEPWVSRVVQRLLGGGAGAAECVSSARLRAAGRCRLPARAVAVVRMFSRMLFLAL